MTTEENFKKLLDIAFENGFDNLFSLLLPKDCSYTVYHLKDNLFDVIVETNDSIESIGYFGLNDLVLETNFFECLFKDFIVVSHIGSDRICFELIKNKIVIFDNIDSTKIQLLKFQWVIEIDEKRNPLEWLFKQFAL